MNIIGIDIGGTKIAFGLVRDGQILCQDRIDTEPAGSFEDKMDELVQGIERLSGGTLPEGIGIGCAGPLDPASGTIENPYTLPSWQGRNIVRYFRERFRVPVILENDVNTALTGIVRFEHPDLKNAVMLTFGTGIGGAVLLDGSLYSLGGRRHPELGHIPVTEDGPECYCGLKGCFESQASGRKFHQTIQQKGFRDLDEYYSRLESEDPAAAETARQFSRIIDRGLSTLKIIFEPDAFILGGGFMDRFFPWYEKYHNPSVLVSEFYKTEIRLIRSGFNGNIAILGAASLAEKKLTIPEGENR